eukprot:360990-Chlamydomonas_euryale.AAC.2
MAHTHRCDADGLAISGLMHVWRFGVAGLLAGRLLLGRFGVDGWLAGRLLLGRCGVAGLLRGRLVLGRCGMAGLLGGRLLLGRCGLAGLLGGRLVLGRPDSHGFPPRPSRPQLHIPEHSSSCRIVSIRLLQLPLDYGCVTVHSHCDFGDMLSVPMASESLAAPQAGLHGGSVEIQKHRGGRNF